VADDEQRRQVERFIDTILPALYCIDVNPVTVEAREQAGDPLSPKALSRVTLTQKRYCACGPPIPTTLSPSLISTRAVCVPPPIIVRFTSVPRRLPRSMTKQRFSKQTITQ